MDEASVMVFLVLVFVGDRSKALPHHLAQRGKGFAVGFGLR